MVKFDTIILEIMLEDVDLQRMLFLRSLVAEFEGYHPLVIHVITNKQDYKIKTNILVGEEMLRIWEYIDDVTASFENRGEVDFYGK